jgi:hypothetical protein
MRRSALMSGAGYAAREQGFSSSLSRTTGPRCRRRSGPHRLFSAFDASAATRDEQAGTATVPISVDGAQVSAYLYYVIKVLRAAATVRFILMGWSDEPWVAASSGAETLEGRLLEIAVTWRAVSSPEER